MQKILLVTLLTVSAHAHAEVIKLSISGAFEALAEKIIGKTIGFAEQQLEQQIESRMTEEIRRLIRVPHYYSHVPQLERDHALFVAVYVRQLKGEVFGMVRDPFLDEVRRHVQKRIDALREGFNLKALKKLKPEAISRDIFESTQLLQDNLYEILRKHCSISILAHALREVTEQD